MTLFRRLQRAAERIQRGRGRTLDPRQVRYDQAWRWFEHRQDIVDQLVEAVADYLPPEGILVDVGANIGYFSLRLMEYVNFRGTAHLFEALSHLAGLCRMTFDRSPYQVTVHGLALAEDNGELELFTANDGNIGWNTLIAEMGRSAGMAPVRVPAASFDSLGLPTPSLIKIDVEGAEYQVLQGMMGTLERAATKPVILCEVGWGRNHPHWIKLLAVLDRMGRLGYRTRNLDRTPVDLRQLDKTSDILLVPEMPCAPSTS